MINKFFAGGTLMLSENTSILLAFSLHSLILRRKVGSQFPSQASRGLRSFHW